MKTIPEDYFLKNGLIKPEVGEDLELFFNPFTVELLVENATEFEERDVQLAKEIVKYLRDFNETLISEVESIMQYKDLTIKEKKEKIKDMSLKFFLIGRDGVTNHDADELGMGFSKNSGKKQKSTIKKKNRKGSGIGEKGARYLLETLLIYLEGASKQVLKDDPIKVMSQFFYMVDQIGADKVSDTMGRICRTPLSNFTKKILKENNVKSKFKKEYTWDTNEHAWQEVVSLLPIISNGNEKNTYVIIPEILTLNKDDLETYISNMKIKCEKKGYKLGVSSWTGLIPGDSLSIMKRIVMKDVIKGLTLYLSDQASKSNNISLKCAKTKEKKKRNTNEIEKIPSFSMSESQFLYYMKNYLIDVKKYKKSEVSNDKKLYGIFINDNTVFDFLSDYGDFSKLGEKLEEIIKLQKEVIKKILLDKNNEISSR